MTLLSPKDYGEYQCVAKNELGTTKGLFRVQGLS